MSKQLTLKNGAFISNQTIGIKGLQSWLGGLMLHGKESRARSRFLRMIDPRLVEFEKERIALIEENAEKGKETGNPILIYRDAEGNIQETEDKAKGGEYKIADKEKFTKEIQEFFAEDFIIDVTPSNREDIYLVRDIVLNTQEEFSGAMAARYDEWCDAFENIGEATEEPKPEAAPAA